MLLGPQKKHNGFRKTRSDFRQFRKESISKGSCAQEAPAEFVGINWGPRYLYPSDPIDVLFSLVGWLIDGFVYPFNNR